MRRWLGAALALSVGAAAWLLWDRAYLPLWDALVAHVAFAPLPGTRLSPGAALAALGRWLPLLLAWAAVAAALARLGIRPGRVRFDVAIAWTPGLLGAKPVVIHEEDRWLHTLVLGPTGAGKTSRVLKPIIWQDLETIRRLRERGLPAGLTVIEPKGDLARDAAAMAEELGLPVVVIDPTDPASPHFNPLEGPADTVAEIMRTVLRAMFGQQEPFFAQVQETQARNVVLLLKALRGDDLTIMDMVRSLRDLNVLARYMEEYDARFGRTDLSEYFHKEVMGKAKDKLYEFSAGLRQQLEDITGNPMIRRVLVGRSGINLDRHLAEGGVLCVNTAMGPLGRLGDLFGMFVMMHFQNAVFRRPGDEWTRPPHVLVVDEFPRFLTADFERMLSIARSYRCATVLGIQQTAQLEVRERRALADVIVGQCRNRIVFGGLDASDARRFEAEFGQALARREDRTYRIGAPESRRVSEEWEPRVRATDLMELPAGWVAYRIVRHGSPQRPGIGRVRLSPWDARRGRSRPPRKAEPAATPEPPGPEEPEFEEERIALPDDGFFAVPGPGADRV